MRVATTIYQSDYIFLKVKNLKYSKTVRKALYWKMHAKGDTFIPDNRIKALKDEHRLSINIDLPAERRIRILTNANSSTASEVIRETLHQYIKEVMRSEEKEAIKG